MIPAVAIVRSRIFRRLTREFRSRIIYSAAAIVAASGFSILGVAAQSKLLAAMTGAFPSTQATVGSQFWPFFADAFLRFILLQMAYELVMMLRRYLQAQLSAMGTGFLREILFDRLVESKVGDAAHRHAAAQVSQLFSSDVPNLANVWAEGILAFASTLALSLGVSIMLAFELGWPGLIFALSLSILVWAARRFAHKTTPIVHRRSELSAKRLSLISETVQAITAVKMLQLEPTRAKLIEQVTALEQGQRIELNALNCTYIPIFASLRWIAWFLIVVSVAFVFSAPAGPGTVRGASVVSLIFAANWYSALLQDAFLWVGMQLNILSLGHMAGSRLDDFLDNESTLVPRNASTGAPTTNLNASAFSQTPPHGAEFRLSGVTIGFGALDQLNQTVLKNVDIEIPRGKLTVVTGRLGSGKSTLLRLLAGELQARAGRVEGNEVPWFLPQEPFVPSATLQQAARFDFSPPSSAIDVHSVLDAVAFLPDLAALEGGLDAWVGERGVTLSGGQRQRLGLARFLARDSRRPLLLDDPFSGLDATTYRTLSNKLLGTEWAARTVVLASTRESDLARAHWVIYLPGDGTALCGTHAKLLLECQTYRQLLDEAGKRV